MFYSRIRKNYKVSAKEEARQIQEETGAYKVVYAGARMFWVFKSPEGEAMVAKFDAESGNTNNDFCTCWG